MTFKIAWNQGNIAKDMRLKEHGCFKEFCQTIINSTNPKYDKLNPNRLYFIRGGVMLEPHRNNENLLESQLVVIDIDSKDGSPASQPDDAHSILNNKGINNFIYTTSSHKGSAPRYRILLPFHCVSDSESQRATAYTITDLLSGCNLAGLDERSFVWSQPWYLTGSQKPTYYGSFDLLDVVIPCDFTMEKAKAKAGSIVTSGSKTYDQCIHDLFKTDAAHPNYYRIAQALLAKNYDPNTAYSILQPIVRAAFESHGREWEDWRNDRIKEAILDGYEKDQAKIDNIHDSNDLPKISVDKDTITDTAFPPGLFGQLCEDFCKMVAHPNKKAAMVMAFAAVAGVAGRVNNISGMGLNIYVALIMESGMGKSDLASCIQKTYLNIPDMIDKTTFLAPGRFTSAKAIWNMFSTGLCKVAIMSEAGMNMKSEAGDVMGVSRIMLNLFSSSGKNGMLSAEGYSDATLDTLFEPALTVVHESTPGVYIEALNKNNAFDRGDFARMWTVFIDEPKSNYVSGNERIDHPRPEVMIRFRELMGDALSNNKNQIDHGKVSYMHESDYVLKRADFYLKLYNKARSENDPAALSIMSRAYQKALKFSAIIDVFNGSNTVTDSTFKWVEEHIVTPEIKSAKGLISHSDNGLEQLTVLVSHKIIEMINKKHSLPLYLCERNMFSKSSLSKIMRRNTRLRSIERAYTGRTGIDVVIQHMETSGYIERVDKDILKTIRPDSVKRMPTFVYMITGTFKLIFD